MAISSDDKYNLEHHLRWILESMEKGNYTMALMQLIEARTIVMPYIGKQLADIEGEDKKIQNKVIKINNKNLKHKNKNKKINKYITNKIKFVDAKLDVDKY